MLKQMTFACLVHKGLAEVRQRPIRELGEHEVLIKNESCNICTTEYGQWLGKREHQGYPMCGGHKNCGYVEAIGKSVTNVAVGDFVTTCGSYKGCDKCEHCLTGEMLYCGGDYVKDADGYYGEFGFSTHQIWDEKYLFKMNKELDPACACFLEPLATVILGQEKLRVDDGETVVVIGGGTMGILNALYAKAQGARVIVSELIEKKLECAKAYGLEVIDSGKCDPIEKVMELTNGEGADAVIIAVGLTIANDQAIKMLKKLDGRVLYFAAGYPAPEIHDIDSNMIHYRRMELIGTYGANAKEFVKSAKLLNSKAIDPSKLVEPVRYPLTKMQDAFAAAATPGMYRVNVECQK